MIISCDNPYVSSKALNQQLKFLKIVFIKKNCLRNSSYEVGFKKFNDKSVGNGFKCNIFIGFNSLNVKKIFFYSPWTSLY